MPKKAKMLINKKRENIVLKSLNKDPYKPPMSSETVKSLIKNEHEA